MTDSELDVLVARKEIIASRVARLTFRCPGGEPLPAWEPGAHVDVILPNGLVRQYSLCGDPADRAAMHIAVLNEPNSRGGSRYVHEQLTEGDSIRIRRPRNNFPLTAAPRHRFIAGGIGITPLVPMLAAADDWQLLYGGRTRSAMAFAEQLRDRYGDRVIIRPQDETGLLDLRAFLATAAPDTSVYCCGPEPLLAAVTQLWPSEQLHVERFAPVADTTHRGPFEVELTQSGRILQVEAGKSILETIEEAGIAVLSSCREGTCGTCEAAVLDGTPDHRDSLLTDQERAACDTMMICVSRSLGPRLVLDL